MAKLITVEQQSSLSLLPKVLSLFSKLYTQFICAKMLIDEAPVSFMDVKTKQCQVILLLNFLFLTIITKEKILQLTHRSLNNLESGSLLKVKSIVTSLLLIFSESLKFSCLLCQKRLRNKELFHCFLCSFSIVYNHSRYLLPFNQRSAESMDFSTVIACTHILFVTPRSS